MEDTSFRGETDYPCRDLCLDPCLPYPSPDLRPGPCLEITELYVDQRVGRRGSGRGSRQRWGETKIETRIGTRIEKPNTLKNTSSLRLVAAVFLAGLLVAPIGHAALEVSLKAETESRFVYEPFGVLLEVRSETEPEHPSVSSGGAFAVTGVMPLTSKGALHQYRIEIMADAAGALTIPPITVKAGEETATTAPLRLTVAAPRAAEGMTLTTTFDSESLYVDQPVTMEVTWRSPDKLTRYWELQMDLPILRDPAWEVYPSTPDAPEKQLIGLPVSGQRMIAVKGGDDSGDSLKFSYVLIARGSGARHPAPAQVQCALMKGDRPASPYPSYFDNHFFRSPGAGDHFERIYFSAPVPALTVQALPEVGRTPRYCGIIGACTARARIEPAETMVGQPMLLTLTLDKLSFGGHIRALPDAVLDDLGPEFQLPREPIRVSSDGDSKSFTFVMRPLRSGIEAIPGLALQFFDPEKSCYRMARTESLPIVVQPDGDETVYRPHTIEGATPPTPLNGIRGNRNESEMLMSTYSAFEFMARYAWVFWLFPPLLWLGLRPWLRRLDRCRTDPAYARAVRAARRFHRACRQDEESAWLDYLADRFDLTAEAVTFESVAGELARHQVPADLVQSIHNRFDREDAEHYAPAGTPPRNAPTAHTLVHLLEKSVRVLLIVICLVPAMNGWASPQSRDGGKAGGQAAPQSRDGGKAGGQAAPQAPRTEHAGGQVATPQEHFEHAMQVRTDKPDEARPLFIEAALGFESEGQHFSAGNSWFFAGKSGRALASYRAAQRRRPFNRQIRESIGFIRAQRADVFPVASSPRARLTAKWNQFCQWNPALRGGLVTLVYLTGWGIFLVARIAGVCVHRRVWITIAILALIPCLSLVRSLVQAEEGIVIESAEGRLGPGYAYDSAYESILHESTEFEWRDAHNGWVLARLPDGNEAWLRETACVRVR
jgi:hypothetical protein